MEVTVKHDSNSGAVIQARCSGATAGSLCVFCFKETKTAQHLFCFCEVSRQIWKLVFQWMGVTEINNRDVLNDFVAFGKVIKVKNRRGIKHLIWLTVVWNLWIARNEILFKGGAAFVTSILMAIKHSAWGWFKARKGRKCGVSWEEWISCPMGSLLLL